MTVKSEAKTIAEEIPINLRAQIEAMSTRYPNQRSAIMPALHLAQEKHGYLSGNVLMEVADILGVPEIWVFELATFYSMYHTEPIGKFHLQICTNISCLLRRAEDLRDFMEQRLQIKTGETTADGQYTLSTVECLGGCDKAPVMMVNQKYYGDLDEERIGEILDQLTETGDN